MYIMIIISLWLIYCFIANHHLLGEDLVQRDDDRPETVSKRLENYQLQTTPLLEYYASVNLLTTFTGTQSDVIWPEVNKFIRDNLNHQFGDNRKS